MLNKKIINVFHLRQAKKWVINDDDNDDDQDDVAPIVLEN